jgi:uncharacterized protein YecT (DUF1311 family)
MRGQGQSGRRLLDALTSVAIALLSLPILLCLSAHSQVRDVRHCLSIANVDDRIECMEGRSTPNPYPAPNTSGQTSIPSGAPPVQMATPSFECGAAGTRIERAICGDPVLAEWDFRMGQLFQQAMQLRPDDRDNLLEGQRSWLAERNRSCGSLPETGLKSCLVTLTRARVAALSSIALNAGGTSTSPSPPPNFPRAETNQLPSPETAPSALPPGTGTTQQAAQTSQAAPQPTFQTSPKSQVAQTSQPPSTSSDQSASATPVVIIALAVAGIWFLVSFVKRARRRQRFILRKEQLIAKYGEPDALKILAQQVWQGMTYEQLVESWGNPADKSQDVLKTKIKETWKYGQTGRNRFASRVYLENGVVVGWQQQ